MDDVVNLRTVRKTKTTLIAQQLADANRAKFGRTKAQIEIAEQERQRREGALDNVRRAAED